jgi:hypothetical protein
MTIIVLTSDTRPNVCRVTPLLGRHNIAGIVLDRRPLALTARHKVERRQSLIGRYGMVRTFNKLLYNWVRSRVLMASESRTVSESLWPGGATPTYARQVPALVVGNVNGPSAALRRKPDAIRAR